MSDPGDEEFAPNGDPIYRHIDPIEGLTPPPPRATSNAGGQ